MFLSPTFLKTWLMIIISGVLEAGMSYMIWVNVMDMSGVILSRSSVDFVMAPGVSGCEMTQSQPYTEMEPVGVFCLGWTLHVIDSGKYYNVSHKNK